MLLRPGFTDINGNYPKLRTLDAYAHIDFIGGTTENVLANYRNINALYHFTPIVNVRSILNHGILSRDQCENTANIICYNIFGLCTDTNRYDGRKEYISCSINKPYYNMLSIKRKYIKKIGGIAILKINKSIINKANRTLFSDGNAAKRINSVKSNEELSTPDNILDDNDLFKLDAEILIRDHIPLEYIESFNFSSCDYSSYFCACYWKFLSGRWLLNFQINDKLFGKNYNE